jgi:ribonuclease P protein subunit POP4
MKKRDIMRSEFIGLDVEVLSAPCYAGLCGIVIDETKNTVTIRSPGANDKMVPKNGNEFRFTYEGSNIVVKGSDILFRPEDRIKKVR